ncbi:MAG: hypothetical protein ACP5RS_03990 [Thermoplasmata archaeon]
MKKKLKGYTVTLNKGESIIYDTGPIIPYMEKVEYAYFLTILLLLTSYFLGSISLSIYEYYIFLLAIFLMAFTIYWSLTESLKIHKTIINYISVWGGILSVLLALVIYDISYKPIENTFQSPWWYPLVNLSIPLAAVMFTIALLIFSSIIYRFISVVKESHRLPITISSSALLLLAIVNLLPSNQYILEQLYIYLYTLFLLTTLFLAIFLFYYLWLRKEDRVIITTQRIIYLSYFTSLTKKEYPYSIIYDVTTAMSNEKYGDMKITLGIIKDKDNNMVILKHYVDIEGIPEPDLMKNTIIAYSNKVEGYSEAN